MTIAITHQFVSAKADGVDVTLVQPSNWGTAATNASNSTHSISMATARLLGRSTAGAGAVEEIDVTNATQRANVGFGGLAVKTTILTADITDANVTLAKLANVSATSRLIGRASAGAGVPEEITIGTGLSLSGTTLSAAVAPPGAFKNLAIKVASNTTVGCNSDFITMTDGTAFQTIAVNGTVNLGTNGAANSLDTGTIAIDTWYYIWAIATAGGSQGFLASLSSTAPTMPAGYTFKARVGAVQTIHSSATLYGTWQLGREAQYINGLAQTTQWPNLATGTTGTIISGAGAGTFVGNANALTRFVPSTASRVRGVISTGNTVGNVAIAPNNSFLGPQGANPIPCYGNGNLTAAPFDFLMESNFLYFATDVASGRANISGWQDNI